MKRILGIILATLLVASFTACNNTNMLQRGPVKTTNELGQSGMKNKEIPTFGLSVDEFTKKMGNSKYYKKAEDIFQIIPREESITLDGKKHQEYKYQLDNKITITITENSDKKQVNRVVLTVPSDLLETEQETCEAYKFALMDILFDDFDEGVIEDTNAYEEYVFSLMKSTGYGKETVQNGKVYYSIESSDGGKGIVKKTNYTFKAVDTEEKWQKIVHHMGDDVFIATNENGRPQPATKDELEEYSLTQTKESMKDETLSSDQEDPEEDQQETKDTDTEESEDLKDQVVDKK